MKMCTAEDNKRKGLERRRLERLAYEWLLTEWDNDYDALKEFLLTDRYAAYSDDEIPKVGPKVVEPWGNINRTPRVSEGPGRLSYNREL